MSVRAQLGRLPWRGTGIVILVWIGAAFIGATSMRLYYRDVPDFAFGCAALTWAWLLHQKKRAG